MKSLKTFVATLAAISLLTGVGFAGESMPGVKARPNAGFENLMMTHYCSLHNQPRMRADAAAADGRKPLFDFADAACITGASLTIDGGFTA